MSTVAIEMGMPKAKVKSALNFNDKKLAYSTVCYKNAVATKEWNH